MDPLLFQYCQKIVLFSHDWSSVLLAKRKGEQDYNGIYGFIGGKMEHADAGIVTGLQREKNEEVGSSFQVQICPSLSYNIFFVKKDGHHMILPHYVARHISGEIVLSHEYETYDWIPLTNLDGFSPKIENISEVVAWAVRVLPVIRPVDWVQI